MLDELVGAILKFVCPPIALGNRRTTLRDTFVTVLHALKLIGGPTISDLATLVISILTNTTDLGTEFRLTAPKNVPAKQIFPWAESAAPALLDVDENDFTEYHDLQSEADTELGFEDSLAVSGLLHILHNCGNRLMEIPEVSEPIDGLDEISKVLTTTATRERLLYTCFSGQVSSCFKTQLTKYTATVHRPRWGRMRLRRVNFWIFVGRFKDS